MRVYESQMMCGHFRCLFRVGYDCGNNFLYNSESGVELLPTILMPDEFGSCCKEYGVWSPVVSSCWERVGIWSEEVSGSSRRSFYVRAVAVFCQLIRSTLWALQHLTSNADVSDVWK